MFIANWEIKNYFIFLQGIYWVNFQSSFPHNLKLAWTNQRKKDSLVSFYSQPCADQKSDPSTDACALIRPLSLSLSRTHPNFSSLIGISGVLTGMKKEWEEKADLWPSRVSKPLHPYWLNKFATNHFTNAQWGAIEVGGNTLFMLCPPPQGWSLDSWLV